MNLWTGVFAKLALSKQEKRSVDSFLNKKTKSSLLAAAQILRKHNRVDEALELLSYGVLSYPEYEALRLSLAKGLYDRGLIEDAWEHLQMIDLTGAENILGKELYFLCAVLLEREGQSYKYFDFLKRKSIRYCELLETFRIDGLLKTKSHILEEFRIGGLEPILPIAGREREELFQKDTSRQARQEPSLLNLDFVELSQIAKYHVSAVDQIFKVSEPILEPKNGDEKINPSSLAKIYEHQGHYEKALEIYQAALVKTPDNMQIKKSVHLLKNKVNSKAPDRQIAR